MNELVREIGCWRLRVTAQENGVCDIAACDLPCHENGDPLLIWATKELEEYFAGERTEFGFPIVVNGTPFQREVYGQLLRVPYGETASYGEMAKRIQRPGASRAVGGACHANRLLIVVPCHRIIAANGRLGGFGAGTEMKEFLLSLERNRNG